jgi:hypothetical protein
MAMAAAIAMAIRRNQMRVRFCIGKANSAVPFLRGQPDRVKGQAFVILGSFNAQAPEPSQNIMQRTLMAQFMKRRIF